VVRKSREPQKGSVGAVYQQEPPGASNFDARGPTGQQAELDPFFPKFAGTELEDFLLAKALECFAHGWSESDTLDRVDDWNVFKAKAAALLDDTEVEAIVARAAKLEKIALPASEKRHLRDKRNRKNRTITVEPRPGYTGPTLIVEVGYE